MPQVFRMRLALAVLLAFSSVIAGAADNSFPGVKRLMTDEEFRETGLQSLSEEELEALDQWLIRYTAGEATLLRRSNDAVREVKVDYLVEARLGDDFKGWSGQTVFRLDNGQVWRQRLSGNYRYRGPSKPKVRIEKNWAGFFRMTLVDEDRTVGVTRLQ